MKTSARPRQASGSTTRLTTVSASPPRTSPTAPASAGSLPAAATTTVRSASRAALDADPSGGMSRTTGAR